MKSKQVILNIALSVSLLFSSSAFSYAQVDADFLKGGIDDGMRLVEAYITPYVKAFGASSNSAWYNTAKPHKFGGFDLTLSVSAGLVPKSDKTFDLSSIGLENLTLVDPSNTIAPTAAGPDKAGPALELIENVGGYDIPIVEFESMPGTGWGVLPAPMLQAGVGMPLGIDLKIRYIPKTPIGEGSVRLLGGGLMHSVSQYFNAFDILPVNISLFGSYSSLRSSIPITIVPDDYSNMVIYSPSDFMDQFIGVDVSSWNVSVVGSVDIPLVSGFISLGYASSTTIIDLLGNIPLPFADPALSTTGPVYDDDHVVTDFDELKIESFSGLRFNVGGKLKLGVFTIGLDYTWAQYNVFTFGMGVSFR